MVPPLSYINIFLVTKRRKAKKYMRCDAQVAGKAAENTSSASLDRRSCSWLEQRGQKTIGQSTTKVESVADREWRAK